MGDENAPVACGLGEEFGRRIGPRIVGRAIVASHVSLVNQVATDFLRQLSRKGIGTVLR
jgi:hypothetical protein